MSESRSREDLELQIVELRTALENEKNRQRADFESLQGQIRVTKEVETLTGAGEAQGNVYEVEAF